MNDIAIRCEGLSKQYRIGERESYKALPGPSSGPRSSVNGPAIRNSFMSEIAIHREGLSKQYRIDERESYKAQRDVITDAAALAFRRIRSEYKTETVLQSEIRNPNSEILYFRRMEQQFADVV